LDGSPVGLFIRNKMEKMRQARTWETWSLKPRGAMLD
jgi:hypothetical protein